MKRALIPVLLALLLAAVTATAQEQTAEATPAPALDKAKQIIDRALEALGGDAFLNVRDIDRRGRLYDFDRGRLASPGTRFHDYVKFPGKEWLEIGKKGNIVYLNNGEEGWELDRQGISEMPPEAIENFHENNKRDFEYLLRFRLREERIQYYYLGREFVDNRRAHIIEMVDDDGESYKLYVDARTYLPMQLHYSRLDVLTGERIPVVEFYGKYVRVQGVHTPMQVSRTRAGLRSFEAFFIEVHYNTDIADHFFSRANLEQRWQKFAKKKKKKKNKNTD